MVDGGATRLIGALLLLHGLAPAADRPGHDLAWALSVDGVSVGTRTLRVSYREDGGSFVRMFEAYTEISGSELDRKRRKLSFRQRLTANSEDHMPASFHSVLDTNGEPLEIQARYGGGHWTITVAQPAGTRTHDLSAKRVDLSTVDLLDPESDRTLHGRDYVRVLTAESGKILEGPVHYDGPSSLTMDGERLEVDVFRWETSQGPWRFWYSSSGFLLRYHAPLMGLEVDGTLTGPAPRGLDEFAVRHRPPAVEVEDL